MLARSMFIPTQTGGPAGSARHGDQPGWGGRAAGPEDAGRREEPPTRSPPPSATQAASAEGRAARSGRALPTYPRSPVLGGCRSLSTACPPSPSQRTCSRGRSRWGRGQGQRELGQAAARPPAPARLPSPHRDPTSGRSTPPPPALGPRRSRKAFLPQSPTSLRRAPAPGRGRPAAVATRSRGCSCCCRRRRAGPERRRAQGEGREGEERRAEGEGRRLGEPRRNRPPRAPSRPSGCSADLEPGRDSAAKPAPLGSQRPGEGRDLQRRGLWQRRRGSTHCSPPVPGPDPRPAAAQARASVRGTPRRGPREAPASPAGLEASGPQGPAEPDGRQQSREPGAHGAAPPT